MKGLHLARLVALTLGVGLGCSADSASGGADNAPESSSRDASAPDASGPDTQEPDAHEPDAHEPETATPVPTGDPCLNEGTPGATATCLAPKHPAAYYAEQANRYFDTLDVDADPESVPSYHVRVARWEWPPWLLLTGLGSEDMISTAKALKKYDPSTVPERDCRGFDTQPFARCRVIFVYEEGPCPIYEEFVFNDAGEMTFIEAWSDLPGLTPISDESDPWGERTDIGRLSTRVPGLGNADGVFDLESTWMKAAAAANPDVADFALRAADWWTYWFEAIDQAPQDFFAKGCGW